MKNLKVALSALAIAAIMTSCSDDEPEAPHVYRRVISFENTGIELAGPTSYGANLYASYTGTKFISGAIEVEKGIDLTFGLNYSDYSADYDFSSGGMVLSQWNYRTDIEGQTEGWWKSYNNQCSVYNTGAADGTNHGAGADGSNTFAVIFGYDDPMGYSGAPTFSFSQDKEYTVEQISICPTSYLYGTITEGNPFGNNPGQSLETARGWFKILAYGYDAQNQPTNGGQPVEKYICDYRNPGSAVAIASTWQIWDLSALGKVNKIKFSFEGSDTGSYGLNTPSYMCLDDITLRLN